MQKKHFKCIQIRVAGEEVHDEWQNVCKGQEEAPIAKVATEHKRLLRVLSFGRW